MRTAPSPEAGDDPALGYPPTSHVPCTRSSDAAIQTGTVLGPQLGTYKRAEVNATCTCGLGQRTVRGVEQCTLRTRPVCDAVYGYGSGTDPLSSVVLL